MAAIISAASVPSWPWKAASQSAERTTSWFALKSAVGVGADTTRWSDSDCGSQQQTVLTGLVFPRAAISRERTRVVQGGFLPFLRSSPEADGDSRGRPPVFLPGAQNTDSPGFVRNVRRGRASKYQTPLKSRCQLYTRHVLQYNMKKRWKRRSAITSSS